MSTEARPRPAAVPVRWSDWPAVRRLDLIEEQVRLLEAYAASGPVGTTIPESAPAGPVRLADLSSPALIVLGFVAEGADDFCSADVGPELERLGLIESVAGGWRLTARGRATVDTTPGHRDLRLPSSR